MESGRVSGLAARTQGLAIGIAGLGIGWLTGLSLSPVVGTVLTSVLGAVAGAVAGLTVLDLEKPKHTNPWPVALLVIGIALGSPLGILARTHNTFGAVLSGTAATDQSVDETEASGSALDERARAVLGVLYGTGTSHCTRLLGSPDDSLLSALRTSALPWAAGLAEEFGDDIAALRRILEVLCEG